MYVGIVWGRCYMIVMLGSHKIISIVRGVSIKLIFFFYLCLDSNLSRSRVRFWWSLIVRFDRIVAGRDVDQRERI